MFHLSKIIIYNFSRFFYLQSKFEQHIYAVYRALIRYKSNFVTELKIISFNSRIGERDCFYTEKWPIDDALLTGCPPAATALLFSPAYPECSHLRILMNLYYNYSRFKIIDGSFPQKTSYSDSQVTVREMASYQTKPEGLSL